MPIVTMTRADLPLSRPRGNPRPLLSRRKVAARHAFHIGLEQRGGRTKPKRIDENQVIGGEKGALRLRDGFVLGFRREVLGILQP